MTATNLFKMNLGDITIPKDNNHKSVKFIHASDIHLGNAQYQNEYRSDDFILSFREILNYAIHHSVDFVLLGGDVFTSLEMLPGTLTKIIKILQDFKKCSEGNIPIIAIEGNHDIRKFSRGLKLLKRGQSWLKLIACLGLIVLLDADLEEAPEGIFPSYDFQINKGGKIQIKNVVIYGNRYIGQTPEANLQKIRTAIKREDNLFIILLQHFGIEGQMINIPGVRLEKAEILKEKVDYLALGHFHKQFIINNWIFNPGSSEAACSIDSTYRRGVFLVEIFGKEKFTKKVSIIRLNNRHHRWEIINLPKQIRRKEELYSFIIQRLKSYFKYQNLNIKPSDCNTPILYLILKGKRPFRSCKINEKELSNRIAKNLPILYVKIYQKFTNSLETLDKYM